MHYADPTAVVDVIKAGATFAAGLLDDGSGTPKYLKLIVTETGEEDGNPVVLASHWELDAAEGLLLKSRKVVQLLGACTVLTAPGEVGEGGEYLFAIDTAAGRRHLAVDEEDPERVTLADP